MESRPCSKVACSAEAVSTLTYVYADSMAVLGPLSLSREPHCYDLCAVHAERLKVPNGWQVVRYRPVGDDETDAGGPAPSGPGGAAGRMGA